MKKQFVIGISILGLIVAGWGGVFVYYKLHNRWQLESSMQQASENISFQRERRVMSPWTKLPNPSIEIAFNGIGTSTEKFDAGGTGACYSRKVFGFSLKNTGTDTVTIDDNHIIYEILGERKSSQQTLELFKGGKGENTEMYKISDVFPITISTGEIKDIEVGFDVVLPRKTEMFKVLWYYQTPDGLIKIDTGKDMEMVCT